MYLRQARRTEAERQARDLVIHNRAFAGGESARKLLDDLQREANDKTEGRR